MRVLLVICLLTPSLALAESPTLADALRVEASWQRAHTSKDASGEQAALSEAARVPWPLLSPAVETALAEQRTKLDPSARQAWALDRALPMLAGELTVSDDVLKDVLKEIGNSLPRRDAISRLDMAKLQAARDAYEQRELKNAEAKYASVAKSSTLWPDALRERAWTLLLMGRPHDALGSTVSLNAPYFPPEDHAEARLLKAAVLLRRCRFAEARDTVAALADMDVPKLDDATVVAALSGTTPPTDQLLQRAWESPLFARVRTALSPASGQEDASLTARRRALTELGKRLLSSAYAADAEVARELKERALKVRYESLRGERGILEQGVTLAEPVPEPPEDLDDDEVSWQFDGTFWRDELGTYRYSAGDACPQVSRR